MEEEKTNKGYKVRKETINKKNSTYKVIMLVALATFLTFLITSIGMYSYFLKNPASASILSNITSNNTNADKSLDNKIDMYKKIIDKYYLGEVDKNKLEEGAIKGYIEGLEDPYTEYISREDMNDYTQDLMGNFTGIGIYMVKDTKTNMIMVLAPIKNSPAEKAGILPGDLIKSVNGEEYKADDLSTAANKIKGETGTEVELGIVRDSQILTFNIKRENIKVNPVQGEILNNNIGYISFSSFDENTSQDFKNKYEELSKKGAKSLIIDLRNNGGGIVGEATKIAEYIVNKDSTILYEVDKNNSEKITKSKSEPIINMPIVVIVNENTASSSEILAGALKDLGKAKIVGTKTYGKGVIQQLLSLPDGSGIKITSEEYQTPNRNKINKVGIEPDEKVELPESVTNVLKVTREEDTQLKKALDMLKQ